MGIRRDGILSLFCVFSMFCSCFSQSEKDRAQKFLDEYNARVQEVSFKSSVKAWAYNTNLTDYNSQQMVETDLLAAKFNQEASANASQFNYKSFDTKMKREFETIADMGTDAMKDETKLKRLKDVLSEMEGIYSKGQVCGVPPDYECFSLEPGLTRIMANDKDYDKLAYVWQKWREVSKGDMKHKYEEFVDLSNEAIKDGGKFNDTGEYWRSWYEAPTFETDLANLLEELKPLYENLHAYVKRKLMDTYNIDKFPRGGHIPAHLLGNMWAQSWINLYDMVEPFKNKTSIDVTPVLKARNFTALKMFKVAEDFFTSLGLKPMPPSFWENSMIEKPTDGREVVCHASAWDLNHGNNTDVRIKMCTDITMDDLVTIHHEMGHIQYYLQYQDQPAVFRSGANPGFHEAIGDVMALSASTPKHLKAIGLLDKVEDDNEADINFLMLQALDKVAFLPFGYLIDQWRWSVFRGDTSHEDYNKDWWDLRCKYQGISPPVKRTSDDFDAGAKYHIPANTPYIRYFVSFVIQFQIHDALCKAADQTGPLYKCDIYNSTKAGTQLSNILKVGASQPWEDTLEMLTGSTKMSTEPLKSYFEPLITWLEKQNKGHDIKWNTTCDEPSDDVEERVAVKFLDHFDKAASDILYRATSAQWNYGSNITNYNQAVMVNMSLEKSDFDKEMASKANSFNWKTFKNPTVVRQFKKITNIGTSALKDKKQLKKMADLQAHIEGIYGKATVTMSNGEKLLLEPGLTEIMTSSRNFSELKEAWVRWRDATGKLMKGDYASFVNISNEAVSQLDYKDTGEYWRNVYESDTFEQDLEDLLEQLKPLYELLHAYVRKQLIKTYGAENFPKSGHIPAHLLGNMWAQHWNNIYDIVEPYPGVARIDVTNEMVRQILTNNSVRDAVVGQNLHVLKSAEGPFSHDVGHISYVTQRGWGRFTKQLTQNIFNFSVKKMFETAEDFFTSLNLSEMPPEFWNGTIMVNPPGIQMVCHASAWDFYNQKDFRIKMCTEVNMEELIVIHHEMGHIQYFLQYKDQPVIFRDGANPGFHEAIGDVMALSVSTPKHLHTIGLLKNPSGSQESDINFLMKMALEKIAFLPFGYLIDQWRWSVFSGETPPEKYNDKWWDLRCKYQGIVPPVERTEDDFDPGAKYHIPANVPYIRYFVSFVVQFQFHKALCDEAGHTGPLYTCDIYKSTAAGRKMREMLRLGSSKPWTEVMKGLTGSTKMQVQPLLDYFKPLQDWLKDKVGDDKGWDDTCSHVTEGDQLNTWLQEYEKEASRHNYDSSEADWNYNTNISTENSKKSSDVSLKLSKFEKEVAMNVSKYNYKMYKDPQLKRRLEFMGDIGTSALKDQYLLRKLGNTTTHMQTIYSTAKVCLNPSNCLKLEPGLTELMAKSRDYEELKQAWKLWRDASGKKMPDLYSEFVNISNQALRDLGYADTGAYWKSFYESDSFASDLEDLLEQLKPLYENLHTYVRRKLMTLYGEELFPDSGHIPAHLLGNMWAQQWNNIYDVVIPFKNKHSVDVSPALKQKGYNVNRMFRTAEEFFTSLGLYKMVPEFWEKSMLTRPEGREVVCHASAWDFSNGKDYRIKMCTRVNMEDLITIHHEMGHIEYYMAYSDQPIPFRKGANPGFHEALGDTMALSVSTPKHLRKIGLLEQGEDDEESEINFLTLMALEKIAFLPFGYLIDQWRWSVFSGETSPEKYNDKWWELRCKYQGVSPPVERGPNDFDPGAKFHIPGNYPYIRYFVSYVVQFQFHKALCEAAGQTGPLHRCDIYQSKEAGEKLKKMLHMGMSRPWPEAMEVLTGQRKMDASAIIEYFSPLIKWLEKQNYNERPGWSAACPKPVQTETVIFPDSGKQKSNKKDTNEATNLNSSSVIVYMICSLFAVHLRFSL